MNQEPPRQLLQLQRLHPQRAFTQSGSESLIPVLPKQRYLPLQFKHKPHHRHQRSLWMMVFTQAECHLSRTIRLHSAKHHLRSRRPTSAQRPQGLTRLIAMDLHQDHEVSR
jgi:hypothetical protein